MGFAATVNRAVSHAKGDIVVLLNSDVTPEKDFLFSLLTHFKDETLFAVGCIDKSIENGKEILRGRGIGKWQRGFFIHCAGDVTKTSTLWVSGGSGAFRKSIWEKLGGFIELYKPFYWEDIDISYRALKAGYRILFEPESIVKHEHEKGSIKKQFTNSFIQSISYRNQILFTWINATDIKNILQHIMWMPYYMVSSIVTGDSAFLKGFWAAVILFPQSLSIRRKVQQMKKKTDAQVIATVSA